jgi:hypothetical protein
MNSSRPIDMSAFRHHPREYQPSNMVVFLHRREYQLTIGRSENVFLNSEKENYLTNKEKNIYHAMDTLIGVNFKELGALANDKINDTCAICLENFKETQYVLFTILECSHVFHRDCIVRVNNNMCPLCKKQIINNLCLYLD